MKLKLQSLKIMLLGMMFMLLGAVIAVDTHINIGGFEFVLLLVGLLMGLIGFWRED
ncbi:MAG TPA: hypothetical protein VGJ97_05950 [Anaerolineaceae bacterium]